MTESARPLLSIITVTKNDYDGLVKTRLSISSQKIEDYEWIVIDGGSTDRTVSYLEKTQDNKIKWISELDTGIYDAMNKGIQISKGRYCLFLNSADELASSSTVASVLRFLDGKNQLIYGDAIEIDGTQERKKQAFDARFYWYSLFTHHQAIFYERTMISSGYDLTYALAADWALTSQLIMSGVRVKYAGLTICKFRRGGSSDNTNLRDIANAELWRIYREVHGRGLLACTSLYCIKRLANFLRLYIRPVYNILRTERAN